MDFHYRIYEQGNPHFVTLTVVEWVDVFIRRNHKLAIVDSLRYCQKNKGLEIYAWCLMPSHLHMIVRSLKDDLSGCLRDFKRHTSTTIIQQIKEQPESRRDWMLKLFRDAALSHPKGKDFKLWQDGNHPVELYTAPFIDQKLNYIHNNPVDEMFVHEPWEYLFSSARNYAGMKGLIDVVFP